jgi:hypothetical protein
MYSCVYSCMYISQEVYEGERERERDVSLLYSLTTTTTTTTTIIHPVRYKSSFNISSHHDIYNHIHIYIHGIHSFSRNSVDIHPSIYINKISSHVQYIHSLSMYPSSFTSLSFSPIKLPINQLTNSLLNLESANNTRVCVCVCVWQIKGVLLILLLPIPPSPPESHTGRYRNTE